MLAEHGAKVTIGTLDRYILHQLKVLEVLNCESITPDLVRQKLKEAAAISVAARQWEDEAKK